MAKQFLLIATCLFCLNTICSAQLMNEPQNWQLLDYSKDSVYGISANRAYDELLKGKKSHTIIVAVIDGGADTTQEDLKNVLWHNPKDKPIDHIDNDQDGYTDDYYGWNFLGGKSDTVNVTKDSYVAARVYFKYKSQFENITDISQVKKEDLDKYKEWQQAKKLELRKFEQNKKDVSDLQQALSFLSMTGDFKDSIKKDSFTVADVEAYDAQSDRADGIKQLYLYLFQYAPKDASNLQLQSAVTKAIDSIKNADSLPTVAPIDYRENVVKDNYDDFNDRHYGNSNISAGDVMHGTHVSGIIGAQRNNGLGIDGIADNVKLIELRAVPDGDEHDKDIALAVRFAVDHGAKVINMSFGKALSPQRKWVEDAFKYAEQHDVLLVHAAGNDGEDISTLKDFPTQYLIEDSTKSFDNMITVGASGATRDNLIAYFSNYSPNAVDVFAPGYDIYSTLPGGNKYGRLSGTSMASPVVAGAAAVLRSYFPKLTAPQIKQILIKSVTPIDFSVTKPTSGEATTMNSLCVSGGIINLYNAVKLAEQMK